MHLKMRYKQSRDLTIEEKRWVEKLLSDDFVDKEVIAKQISTAKVTGYCECGCRTIDLDVDKNNERFLHTGRVPVEMIIETDSEAPVVVYLHVVDGYVNELEVFKADSSPIRNPLDLSNAQVKSNI